MEPVDSSDNGYLLLFTPLFTRIEDEGDDGFWVLEAMWVMSDALLADDFDRATECLVGFLKQISVFLNRYNGVRLTHNME
jgi:hypothetical protein